MNDDIKKIHQLLAKSYLQQDELLPIVMILDSVEKRLNLVEGELGRIKTVISAEKEAVSPKEDQHPYMLVQRLIQELRASERSLENRNTEIYFLRKKLEQEEGYYD